MHDDIAAIDRGLYRCGIVLDASAGAQETPVNIADLDPAGMVGLNPIRYLQQLPDRGVDVDERAIFLEFHRTRAGSTVLICETCTTVSSSRWLSKISPQGHFMREFDFCDGIRSPAFRIAYFRSVQSR
jgi:hypothetical protein